MKKTIILLIFLSLAAVISIFAFLNKNKRTQINTIPLKPDIPNYITGKLPVNLKVPGQDFNFPKKLPTISIVPHNLNKTESLKIAGGLAFNSNPEEFEDVNEGIKYYWTTENEFLVITPKTATIKFGLNSPEIPKVVNKQLTENELQKSAEDFISKYEVIDTTKIRLDSITPYKESVSEEGLVKTSSNSASVFQVNFSYVFSDHSILTLDPSFSLISVQVLPDGSIFNSQVILLDNINSGLVEYDLKSFDDVSSNLDQAKLIKISNGYLVLSDINSSDIKFINIEHIKLSYLLDASNSKDLKPVYVLEGPTQVVGTEANFATLYMPAFK